VAITRRQRELRDAVREVGVVPGGGRAGVMAQQAPAKSTAIRLRLPEELMERPDAALNVGR